MTDIGQRERETQRRVVKLFRDTLGYDYLGDWTDRPGNSNIEEDLLRTFLREHHGNDEALITRALHILDKAARDTSKSLYDRNRDVYGLLRYAVKVKPGVGENTVDVWLIDWEHPEKNHLPSPRKSPLRPPTRGPTRNARTWCSTSTASRLAVRIAFDICRRRHSSEPRQPEKRIHPAVLLDDAVGDGGKRYGRPALRQ